MLNSHDQQAHGGADDYVIGIDVGGTFTDVVCSSGSRVWRAKAPTDPQRFEAGVLAGCDLVADKIGISTESLMRKVSRFGLGTTAVTNVLAARTGRKTGFLTTAGFEGHLLGARGARTPNEGWLEMPWMPLNEDAVKGLRERIDRNGDVIIALDPADVRQAISTLVNDEGVEAIAVSLLWSFRNPVHEDMVASIAAEVAPDVPVFRGHSLHPQIREYERSTTAVLSAFASAALDGVDRLEAKLEQLGLAQPLLLLHSGGGAISLPEAREAPLKLASSGPAAGAVAAAEVVRAAGIAGALCCDIGGTSVDVAVIRNGEAERRQRAEIGGVVTGQSAIDVESIGAGGGSIAWLDSRGLIRIGPKSARATPGPACYGRGGTEATVTDAMLLLGFIDPDNFLGGGMRLDKSASEAAYARLGAPLGLSAIEAALGAREIAIAEMAKALRSRIASGGLDPRQFYIVSYGGSGGLFSAELAAATHVGGVIAPGLSSVLSAFGAASADLRRERSASVAECFPVEQAGIAETLQRLHAEVVDDLKRDGVAEESISVRLEAELRLYRQKASLTLPLDGATLDQGRLLDEFRSIYADKYGEGALMTGTAIELSSVMAIGVGATRRAQIASATPGLGKVTSAAPNSTREIWLSSDKPLQVPVYATGDLEEGMTFTGPALFDAPDTTIWAPANTAIRVGAGDSLIIDFLSAGEIH